MIGRNIAALAAAALASDQSDGSLWEIVGGRIYETARPQTAEMPCIECLTQGVESEDGFTRSFGAGTYEITNYDGELQILVSAPLGDQETQVESAACEQVGQIAALVRTILHGHEATSGDLTLTYIQRQAETITISDEAATGQMTFAAIGSTCRLEA